MLDLKYSENFEMVLNELKISFIKTADSSDTVYRLPVGGSELIIRTDELGNIKYFGYC